jgi:cyclic nucleotide gated channel alpha 3
VNGGKLHVISDNGKIVLATLKAGSYFGEISVLNMGASGNRRTASVRSVGYSDLFCLAKEDLWEVLKEYPAVRVKLEAIAIKRLENHKKPMSETVNLKRCKSAPSLMEPSLLLRSQDLKDMKRHGTLPSSLLKRTDISMIIRKDSQSKSGKNSAVLPSSSKSTLTLTRIDETRNKQSKDEIAKSNRINDNDLQISIPKFDLNMSESKLREKAKNEKYILENETLQKYEQAHLIKEIKRLRRRIVKLEAENSQLSNIDLSKRGKETSIGSSANSSRSKNNSERMLAKEESDTDEFKV